jgi:hypothetical protein
MCKVTKKTVKASASLAALITYATLGIWVTTPNAARAHQEPLGCAGNGSGGTIGVLNGAFHHVGDAVDFTVGINVPAGQCQGSNITARIRFPDNTFLDYATNLTLNPGAAITCPNAADPRCLPGPYRYIVRAQDLGKQTVETNLPNVDCRSPSSATSVYGVGTASGTDHTGPGTLESTFSDCRNIPITIFQPAIVCTKTCVNGVGQNGTITFSGSVSNSGVGTPLAPVSVSNLVNGVLVLVTNITQLDPGAVVTFGGSYVPANPCVPTTDTIFVRGTDPLGSNVTSQCSATCSNVITPCIFVTKTCPGPVVVGGTQTISGIVSNCGNITLTNVILDDNIIGAVTNFATLVPGQSFPYSKSFTAGCANNTNTVTARGTTICGVNITNTATAICAVTESPCIAVTKNCAPPVINTVGGIETFSGVVSNCGNITLTNVTLFDTFLNKTIATIATLPVGGSQAYTTNYTTVAADVGKTLTNTIIAVGRDLCNTQSVTNQATCTFRVEAPPCINVTKEIACFIGTNAQGADVCSTFSHFAIGVQGDTQDPAFCYRITVTNCADVALTNVTVIDDKYGNLTSHFTGISPVFAAHGTATFSFKAELDNASPPSTLSFVTNTVVARGQSQLTGAIVTAQDQAVAEIVPAAVSCIKSYSVDGGPRTNNATLDSTGTHTIVWFVTILNTGYADLTHVVVTDASSLCNAAPAPFSLPRGASNVITLCTITNFVCTNGGLENTVRVVADRFAVAGNTNVCAHDLAGTQITVRTECSAQILCSTPAACRVTGGGRQDDPLVCPHDVRYVTHGGQVGAPVGNQICVVTTNFTLGNPCIHGRWTHVRHVQGGLEGNFHARFFDTLDCACLDDVIGTNGVYGPGTVVGGLCNPGDRVAGPEPRPAPANKIVFTGVGDWADPNGRRAPRATLFRVDIEDRSEPGGSHPKGGTPPPDRYRIRIWVLTDAELAQLNGGAGDRWLLHFRNCISACNGLNVRDGINIANSCGGTGTITFAGGCPVRKPDIDDGGELERGNHQIHPSIKTCDPFNPTGPGLANP